MSETESADVRGEIPREHRELLDHVVELQRHASLPETPEERTAWALESGAGLEKLLVLLEAHFRREEEPGGLYQRLAEARPGLAAELEALREEHGFLLGWGRELQTRARGPQTDLRGLEEGVNGFFRALAHHETREEQMIREASLA